VIENWDPNLKHLCNYEMHINYIKLLYIYLA
jgi:hypothetical protein